MHALKVIHQDQKLLSEEIRKDIQLFYEKTNFRWESRRAFCNFLAEKTDLSYKTIDRILKGDNFKPNYHSTIKIYLTIHQATEISELFERGPVWIKDYIQSHIHSYGKEDFHLQNKNVTEYLMIREQSLTIYLYVSAFGKSVNDIKNKFGEYGLDEVFKMIELQILRMDANRIVTWNEKATLAFTPETLKAMSGSLIKNFYRPEAAHTLDENYMASTITNISPQAKVKIIKAMEQLQKHINEIIKIDDGIFKAHEQTEKIYTVISSDKVS